MKHNALNHLQSLIEAFVNANIHFVVAGGVAAVLHGVERMTMDLDISLEMSEKKKKSDTFKEQLKKCEPTDFDGHTNFSKLTAEEKLMWLSQAAQFAVNFTKTKNK